MASKQHVTYPSLEEGWLKDPRAIADKMFSDYLKTDYSQTYISYPYVKSMMYVIQENQNNINDLISALQSDLIFYFERAFNSVSCEIEDRTQTSTPSYGQLVITLMFYDNEGKRYDLRDIVQYDISDSNKMIKVLDGAA